MVCPRRTLLYQADTLKALWVHEVTRIFHDQLNTSEHQKWWWNMVAGVAKEYLDLHVIEYHKSQWWGDFAEADHHEYVPLPAMEQLENLLLDFLQVWYSGVWRSEVYGCVCVIMMLFMTAQHPLLLHIP